MTFDEWWATTDLEKAGVPGILKQALKEFAKDAWEKRGGVSDCQCPRILKQCGFFDKEHKTCLYGKE